MTHFIVFLAQLQYIWTPNTLICAKWQHLKNGHFNFFHVQQLSYIVYDNSIKRKKKKNSFFLSIIIYWCLSWQNLSKNKLTFCFLQKLLLNFFLFPIFLWIMKLEFPLGQKKLKKRKREIEIWVSQLKCWNIFKFWKIGKIWTTIEQKHEKSWFNLQNKIDSLKKCIKRKTWN
jgi:hypothetical protein